MGYGFSKNESGRFLGYYDCHNTNKEIHKILDVLVLEGKYTTCLILQKSNVIF